MPPDEETGRAARALRRAAGAARRVDASPALLWLARWTREFAPGDSRFGDPLSTAGSEPPHALARSVAALSAERPSALGQVGLGALQVWQAISESQGRGRGDRELAILFTDLVDFSTFALEAGDEAAVDLLRDVSEVVEPAVRECGGEVVKRLGDGLMAVFVETSAAVAAAQSAVAGVAVIEADGYRPALRAGIHRGRPRKLAGDYLGVDVNIAARVAQAAAGGEILLSEPAREKLADAEVSVRRRWRFRAKGAPKDLRVYSVETSA